MKLRLVFSICAVALATLCFSQANADDLKIELDLSGGDTWELYAEVVDTGSGADGSLGLASIRALIDGIDFGTDGDAVTIAGDIGAINPVNGGPPVLDLGGGLIEVLYGQDISSTGAITGGVGNGGRKLIANGTYSGADPSFGMDGSLESEGLFLTSTTPGGGEAIDPDNIMRAVNVDPGVLKGDVSLNGSVGFEDIQPFVDILDAGGFQAEADISMNGSVGFEDIQPFIDILNAPVVSAVTVPEPTTALLFATAVLVLGNRRRMV